MKLTWKELKQELKEHDYIGVLWHKDDVVSIVEKRGYTYTDEDIQNIMDDIEKYFDAQVGVNWDTIEIYVEDYFNNRQK